MLLNISGIYTWTNLINNKIYIGFATKVATRKQTHLNNLRRNNHCNSYLQEDFILYGEINFEFDLLVECEERFLSSEEHYWATILNVHDRKFGYNIKPTHPENKTTHNKETRIKIGNRHRGKKVSDEAKLKMSIGHKGKKLNPITDEVRKKMSESAKGKIKTEVHRKKISETLKEEHKKGNIIGKGCKNLNTSLSKAVLQYDLEGNFVKEWLSMSEANRNGYSSSKISMCCKNQRETSNSFRWRYKTDNYPLKIEKLKDRITSEKKKKSLERFRKPVLQIDVITKNIVKKWESIAEINRNLGYDDGTLSLYLNDKMKTNNYKGFIWKFAA